MNKDFRSWKGVLYNIDFNPINDNSRKAYIHFRKNYDEETLRFSHTASRGYTY